MTSGFYFENYNYEEPFENLVINILMLFKIISSFVILRASTGRNKIMRQLLGKTFCV